MTTAKGNVVKYRKLLGVSETADLSELKKCYAGLNEKFQAQSRADDPVTVKKGQNNIRLLNKAFDILAADIRSKEIQRNEEQTLQTMIVEHASIRVGFQVLEGGSKFFALETSRISGFGSTRTNNILSSSWPSGKLSIFDNHLEFKCMLGSHIVDFHNIDCIDKAWYIPFWLRVRQNDKNAESVHIFGWGLAKKLQEVVKQNSLSLKLVF